MIMMMLVWRPHFENNCTIGVERQSIILIKVGATRKGCKGLYRAERRGSTYPGLGGERVLEGDVKRSMCLQNASRLFGIERKGGSRHGTC